MNEIQELKEDIAYLKGQIDAILLVLSKEIKKEVTK